jgi:hypothetical protein
VGGVIRAKYLDRLLHLVGLVYVLDCESIQHYNK